MAGAHTIARLYSTFLGVNAINSLHFGQNYNTLAEKQALAIAIRDRFLPGFKTGTSSSLNFFAIEIANVSEANDTPYTLATNVVGGMSGTLPLQCAIMWKLSTGQAGRRGRGRLFVPCIGSPANSGGQIASATALSLNAEMTTANQRWAVGGSEVSPICVYSRKDDTCYPVVQFSFNLTISTLRSRRLGTGI